MDDDDSVVVSEGSRRKLDLQVVLVIREQCLRALGPQRLHGVLGLSVVVPLEEAHQDLAGLARRLGAFMVVFFDYAHDVRYFGLPAALGKGVVGLLHFGAIGLALAATTLLCCTGDRRVERFRGCALLCTLLLSL